MQILDLCGEYQVTGISPQGEKLFITGSVPGCVHTDLMRAEAIRNIFFSNRAASCQWVEEWEWQYERIFTLNQTAGDEQLLFHGLDTVCDIYLNGKIIGSAQDMFISYSFPVGKYLKAGQNVLRVCFHPAALVAKDKPALCGAFTCERMYVRKMQCSFGWDWAQRFVGCGIWKEVELVRDASVEFNSAAVFTRLVDAQGAQLEVLLNCKLQPGVQSACAQLKILSPEDHCIWHKNRMLLESETEEYVTVTMPQLWYPAGYGHQPLYRLVIALAEGNRILQEQTIFFGIRTVQILQIPDVQGGPEAGLTAQIRKQPHLKNLDEGTSAGFIVCVNGVRVMCKGANWVPCDPFVSNIDDRKYQYLLTLAAHAHINMLRVWGGGIFENETFYQTCDKLGILVVQDFLMACGVYPEHEAWFENCLRAEAETACIQLRNHPSLIGWIGDNENGASFGQNSPAYPGRHIALEILAPVLKKLDPTRFFLPSSPYFGKVNACATIGTTHNTYFLDQLLLFVKAKKFDQFQNFLGRFLARFVAENPLLGAPALCSLERFMTQEEIHGQNDEVWKYHTKVNPTPELLEYGFWDALCALAQGLFGTFCDPMDRILKLQYVQYEWARITMEQFRRNKWYSSGLLYWMLDDYWPASGWSMIDYYGVPKAGFYAFRDRAKPVIASICHDPGILSVYVCNDSLEVTSGTMHLAVYDVVQGREICTVNQKYWVEANTSVKVWNSADDDWLCKISATCILRCELLDTKQPDVAYYLSSCFANLSVCKANVSILEQDDESILIQSDAYVHCVGLDGEYVFEDNYFSLKPNEPRQIHFSKAYAFEKPDIRLFWM